MSGTEMLVLEMSDRLEAMRQERDAAIARAGRAEAALAMLRRALARLVGVDTVEELRNMETIIRAAPAPAQDKAAAIDAIHALIEVQP